MFWALTNPKRAPITMVENANITYDIHDGHPISLTMVV